MTTLRIHDLKQHVLAFDLRDILRRLPPRSLQAEWTISAVRSLNGARQWFEATGANGEKLEALAQEDARLSGDDLIALARDTQQVIWGQFAASLPAHPEKNWITVRAIDSCYYEITTGDETVLNVIRSSFKDVRTAEAPFG